MRRAPIIAIDGPAGSGKSTAAKNMAQALGFSYIDTGAMYRAATWQALRDGVDLEDEAALTKLAETIDIRITTDGEKVRVFVGGVEVTDEIRSEQVSRQTYHISGSAECRKHIVALQQRMGADGGVVAEGRDIGTVVFPDAELKFFVVADVEERARRRRTQLLAAGEKADFEDVLREMKLRDKRDSERAASPLKKASDAVVVDTTRNSIEQTLAKMLGLVRKRFPELAESRSPGAEAD